jgi:hypothetical protein
MTLARVSCTLQAQREAPTQVPPALGSWVAAVAAPLAGLQQVVGGLQASTAKGPMVSLGPAPAWVARAAATAGMEPLRMVLGPVVVQVV